MKKEIEIKEIERAIAYEKEHRNDAEMIADLEKYLLELINA